MCNSQVLGTRGDLRLLSSTLSFISKKLRARKNLDLWLQLTRSQAHPGLHSKNISAHFKGGPGSVPALGLAGAASAPAFPGIQVISHPRAISGTNSGLLLPLSPTQRRGCFCQSLSEEWTNLTGSLQHTSSHISLALTGSYISPDPIIGKGTTHPQTNQD